MGFKWLKDFVEDIRVGLRYFDKEFGEFLISVFKSIDSIDDGVLESVRFRFIFVESFGFGKLECGRFIIVDFSDVVVDGGCLLLDFGFLCRVVK